MTRGWLPRASAGVLLAVMLTACGGEASTVSARGSTVAGAVEVHRSATCQCCKGHERHLTDAGRTVESVVEADMPSFKDEHGVPQEARSCHTALIDGYVVEGHVPEEAIAELLRERPAVDGIALPGMPPGAPGMNGTADGPLTVVTFTDGEVGEPLTW